jgi:hypothetical protein
LFLEQIFARCLRCFFHALVSSAKVVTFLGLAPAVRGERRVVRGKGQPNFAAEGFFVRGTPPLNLRCRAVTISVPVPFHSPRRVMAFEREKRCEERFPASGSAACVFASPLVEDFGPVKIKNVSLKGVGLITSKPPDVGSLLAVKLANSAKNFTKTALVRVIHVTPQPGGIFSIGGDWDTPLTYEELCNLVM